MGEHVFECRDAWTQMSHLHLFGGGEREELTRAGVARPKLLDGVLAGLVTNRLDGRGLRVESDDTRQDVPALLIGDDARALRIAPRDEAVGGAQVDADDRLAPGSGRCSGAQARLCCRVSARGCRWSCSRPGAMAHQF